MDYVCLEVFGILKNFFLVFELTIGKILNLIH